MQSALTFATAAPVGSQILSCPNCHGECRALVSEWRGYSFKRHVCAICANEIVKAMMKNAVQPPKVSEN